MKLLRDEMVRTGDAPPLDLLKQGIRADETRGRYVRALRLITGEFLDDLLEGTFEERVAQLVRYGRDDPDWTLDLLFNMSRKLRERTRLARDDPDYLNPTSFPNYFVPLKKLFDMNNVVIPWNRVYATYPELDNMPDTDGWTREEIAQILRQARDVLDRALVLVLASSGVRSGALAPLNWGDLTPVYRVGDKLSLDPGEGGEVACAILEVYRGTSESYTAFITPEAFEALQDYGRAWSKHAGRQAKSKDPIFVRMRGIPLRMERGGLRQRMEKMLERSELRGECRQGKRYRVPLLHGFRRFFNKTTKDAPTPDTAGMQIRTEYMMGHRGVGPLDRNYYKTNVLDLAAAYVLAVPDLTIDDADRLRLSNRMMSDNLRKAEGEKVEMERMKEEVERMKTEAARMKTETARMELEKAEALKRMEAGMSELAHSVKEKDELVARLEREKAEERSGSEKDAEMARMRKEMERTRAEAARTQEEVAELKQRRDMSISDVLAALGDSDGTKDVSKRVVDSLAGTFQSLAKAQEARLREVEERSDARMAGMMRAMERMARQAGIRYDPLEEPAEDEPPETNPLHRDPRDSGLC